MNWFDFGIVGGVLVGVSGLLFPGFAIFWAPHPGFLGVMMPIIGLLSVLWGGTMLILIGVYSVARQRHGVILGMLTLLIALFMTFGGVWLSSWLSDYQGVYVVLGPLHLLMVTLEMLIDSLAIIPFAMSVLGGLLLIISGDKSWFGEGLWNE